MGGVFNLEGYLFKILIFKWLFSGVGYHIIMVKEPHCNVEEIIKVIDQHIPEARLESDVAAELSFILPKKYTHRYGSRKSQISDFGLPEITIAFPGFLGLGKQITSHCHLTSNSQFTFQGTE